MSKFYDDLCPACATNPKCPVATCINNLLLFVIYDRNTFCKKAMSFGDGYICLCVGRKEYYDLHQK